MFRYETASQTVLSTTKYYFCLTIIHINHRNTGINVYSSDRNTDVCGCVDLLKVTGASNNVDYSVSPVDGDK